MSAPGSIGVVAPYDFALDRELWRWTPDPVTLLLTRTPFEPLPVSVAQAHAIGSPEVVCETARTVLVPAPDVLAYACTAGSFVAGHEGEARLRAALDALGPHRSVTTSGAVVAALLRLGAARVCVATPYDDQVTALLVRFLQAAGIEVLSACNLGLTEQIWSVPPTVTAALIRDTFRPGCDAVFVSCTNVATYDLIAVMERELGVPVVSANQATMWSALAGLGLRAVGEGQRLLDVVA